MHSTNTYMHRTYGKGKMQRKLVHNLQKNRLLFYEHTAKSSNKLLKSASALLYNDYIKLAEKERTLWRTR